LEEIVGGLEGRSSVAFASGMAGIAAVFDQLPAGAKVALPDDCYQGVAGLANAGRSRDRWHEAARRQLKGFGTIISFDIRGGAEAADAVCARLRLIQHATSLGAVESTIERRASVPGQEHLPPSLLRLSVGIEGGPLG